MYPHQAAKEKPLAVIFCWERFDLLRMTLPRVVNATRRIGGYLWAIDDGSDDDRVPRMLMDYKTRGFIDWVTLGENSRFIDWSSSMRPFLARRMVVMRWLFKQQEPLVLMIEADIVIGPDVFENMLEATVKVFKVGLSVSSFSGFHFDTSIFGKKAQIVDNFEIRLFCQYIAQPLLLIPFCQMQLVEEQLSTKGAWRFSVNEYAARAFEIGLEACWVMNLPVQHLGLGIIGRGIMSNVISWVPVGWTNAKKTKRIQVPGFDVDLFMKVAGQTSLAVQEFAKRDEKDQVIGRFNPVSKWFSEYLKMEKK